METNNPYQPPANSQLAAPRPGIKNVLLSFSGRIPRRIYWLYAIIISVVFGAIAGLVAPMMVMPAAQGVEIRMPATPIDAPDSDGMSPELGAAVPPEINPVGAILMVALFIPLIWISLALQVKRWHDRNKSGAWVLINLIPLVGPIWCFVECGCLRGTLGANTYGADPT